MAIMIMSSLSYYLLFIFVIFFFSSFLVLQASFTNYKLPSCYFCMSPLVGLDIRLHNVIQRSGRIYKLFYVILKLVTVKIQRIFSHITFDYFIGSVFVYSHATAGRKWNSVLVSFYSFFYWTPNIFSTILFLTTSSVLYFYIYILLHGVNDTLFLSYFTHLFIGNYLLLLVW